MLSQLTLRFPKKLIEALKVRADRENTPVALVQELTAKSDEGALVEDMNGLRSLYGDL